MATNTAPATPPSRYFPGQRVHYLRKRVRYNDVGIDTGVKLAASLPAGAIIIDVLAIIMTAFNAATTNVLNVGTTATGGEIAAAASTLSGATGAKRITTGVALGPMAAETPVYVSYTQSGTAASAGDGYIVLTYVLDNDA